MIFSTFTPDLRDGGPNSILTYMEGVHAEAVTINQTFWAEGTINTRYECGDTTLYAELFGNLPLYQRRQFSLNHIRPMVNMVSGHQRRTRKSITVIPVENGDAKTADQFTKVMMHLVSQESILETISDTFQGALVTGMNLLHVWVDYRNDPISGDIKVDQCHYNSFIMDPYFKKADLSDCNYIWKRTYLTPLEVSSLLPDYAEEIADLPLNSSGTATDNKFWLMPEKQNFTFKNLLSYDEFYYKDYRTQKMLVDIESGDTIEWRSENTQGLKEYLRQFPNVQLIETQIPTVRLAIVVQGKVFYDGPNPLGLDCYPVVPVFAYYNPQVPYYPQRIQGLVTALRDVQYLFTRSILTQLDIIESKSQSGWIYKENALVDPNSVFNTGQGRSIAIKSNASLGDIQQIPSSGVDASIIQVSQNLESQFGLVSGINKELLGSADDDKAGILSMLRQGAGLTTLEPLLDNLDRSQKNLGRLLLKLIQIGYTPGKIEKIIQEKPTDQFYNKAFGKYDVVIEDGINTSTQRQMQFAQLLELREKGVPISSEDLLNASTFQGKTQIIENIKKQEEQQAQIQKQQMEIQMQAQIAQLNLAASRSQAELGLANERNSRVAENKMLAVERVHEANHRDAQATLDKVKAMKELESMDVAHLQQLVTLINMFKQQQQDSIHFETQHGEAEQAINNNISNV